VANVAKILPPTRKSAAPHVRPFFRAFQAQSNPPEICSLHRQELPSSRMRQTLRLAVCTSTNYNTRGMHQQTDKIMTGYVLAAVEK
jgi:hypothetical protein